MATATRRSDLADDAPSIASRRTLGTGPQQAAAGNHTHTFPDGLRLLHRCSGQLDALGAGTRFIGRDGGVYLPGDAGSLRAAFPIDPARYVVDGRPAKFLGLAWAAVGDIAPATTMAVALHSMTSPSGGSAGMKGADGGSVSGSTFASWGLTNAPSTANQIKSPADSTATAADFTIATAGLFAVRVQNFANMIAGSSVTIFAELWVHNPS